ncbi:hypothetical protein GCM10008018_15030 [Paenibacillus marchantiophytorum]|uniref:Uncharacterized protein n=1 Tax=Paenibacillus marchantiophytorum TaxID=1619310 RepID=A0ABQ2BT19_9BACL|nr:hypothetical protein GCM10008018_15030 [Paenibacillus marchantiophytorum]
MHEYIKNVKFESETQNNGDKASQACYELRITLKFTQPDTTSWVSVFLLPEFNGQGGRLEFNDWSEGGENGNVHSFYFWRNNGYRT